MQNIQQKQFVKAIEEVLSLAAVHAGQEGGMVPSGEGSARERKLAKLGKGDH
jgi:hypothetical protein